MSGKPTKMKTYASFADWHDDQSEQNKIIIAELQKLIEQTAPQLTSTVKWGQGCWQDDTAPRVFVHAEPDHVQLGFYNGSTLQDPHGLLSGNGKYVRFVKVYGVTDIKPEAYSELIKQAVS